MKTKPGELFKIIGGRWDGLEVRAVDSSEWGILGELRDAPNDGFAADSRTYINVPWFNLEPIEEQNPDPAPTLAEWWAEYYPIVGALVIFVLAGWKVAEIVAWVIRRAML